MTQSIHIFIVEDNKDHVLLIKRALRNHHSYEFTFRDFPNGDSFLHALKTDTNQPDLILLDYKIPGKNGLELLNELRERSVTIPVIMVTSYGSIESAVHAIKEGAFDYLTKPFRDPKEIFISIEKALRHREIVTENFFLRSQIGKNHAVPKPIESNNPQMKSIQKTIARIAPTESTVLLTGESGTGKEILSHYIHALSPRQSHKFLAINCSALPENLLETELFGHVKGSFTGATHNKIGLLKEAHHGTFFFDEISELPMAMQTKLLRFLQDHEIRPTGSVQSERVDVRILAATNRDLLNEVKAGRFREDLFYRFNVISIHIPPLRERKEDIPQLIEQFIETHNQAFGKNIQGIQPQALKALVNLPWPGNIRELKNVLERALIFSNSSEISLESLAFLHEIQSHGNDSPNKGVPYSQAREQVLSNFTSQYLDEILRKHKGNVTKAAQAAKLGRQSFHRLLKIHQIDSQTYRQDDLLKN